MQMVFLSKLETAFTVPTRGCVIVPVAFTNPDIRVKPGDAVQLRGPNGCVESHITAVENLVRDSAGFQFGFLLSDDLDCSTIPVDAEIWIDQD